MVHFALPVRTFDEGVTGCYRYRAPYQEVRVTPPKPKIPITTRPGLVRWDEEIVCPPRMRVNRSLGMARQPDPQHM